MAKIDSAYDYYMTTYASQRVSRYDSHKKSDLRRIYNHIVKANKESPLYKISNLSKAKRYAIDIKENAKAIQNVVASLSDPQGDSSDSFQKKVAYSSDEDTVSVEYIGDGKEKNGASQFEITINRLASPQINTGNYLKNSALSFTPGSYSFDLNTTAAAYEFQYNINDGETNRDVLNKLASLVNSSNLGISASILENGEDASALSLVSAQTGLGDGEESLFSISPASNPDSMRAMDLLGINNITSRAQNSEFLLNNTPQSSLSNTFTINNTFELTLKQPTAKDTSTKIGFKTNSDAVADNIQTLVDAFNNIIKTAQDYAANGQGKKLLSDMSGYSKGHREELKTVGLMVDDDGNIAVDREVLADALAPGRTASTFDTLTRFRDGIGAKADNASINPMHYVNKVIVAYKNPGRNFPAPYISSIYSGMMLDRYV